MSDNGNNNNGESTSDDMSGLTGFFFYMFIVHPITAWILKPGRFERQKSIMYAIIFLASLAAIKTGTFLVPFFVAFISKMFVFWNCVFVFCFHEPHLRFSSRCIDYR